MLNRRALLALSSSIAFAAGLVTPAHAQGKLEPVLQALLQYQPEWADHASPDLEKARSRAGEAGLNVEQGKRDKALPEISQLLQKDMADVKTMEVRQTPSFYVNGEPLTDFGPQQLYQLVKRKVDRSKR